MSLTGGTKTNLFKIGNYFFRKKLFCLSYTLLFNLIIWAKCMARDKLSVGGRNCQLSFVKLLSFGFFLWSLKLH